MKVWEKVIQKKLREKTTVKKPVRLTPGMLTMEPIFCMKQLIEMYWGKKQFNNDFYRF